LACVKADAIATAIFAQYGSGYAVALFIFACAVISLAAAAAMKDHTNQDISEEYDQAGANSSVPAE